MITNNDIRQFKKEEPKKLLVYTSQFRYSGPRRLDITARGSDLFAPPWELVTAYKNGHVSEIEYEKVYREMMRKSYIEFKEGWNRLLEADWTVLVCYCKTDTFCHRLLLADYLEKLGAEYKGEIPNI